MEDLAGKVAVITGGASGIGRAMAERFAADGMKLVLGDIEEPALDVAAAQLRSAGAEVVTAVVDVAKRSGVEHLRDTALDAFGAVHLVCNNAGVGGGGLINTLSDTDWEWVLGVNLWGIIYGQSVFLPLLLEQKEGHIVNTASVAGLIAGPFMGPYNASKAAAVAVSETLFQELKMAGTNVGVSVLCPAWVATQIAKSSRNRPAELQDPKPVNTLTDGESTDGESTDAGMVAMLHDFIQSGMAPAEVADRVHRAVTGKEFWIVTHDSSREAISARFDTLLAGGEPPMVMP